jgi:3-hydroxypropanoate dehydrogenase
VTQAVNDDGLDILFRKARTHRAWRPGSVTPQMLMAIYDLARWGPTTNNTSPMRVVFIVSPGPRNG